MKALLLSLAFACTAAGAALAQEQPSAVVTEPTAATAAGKMKLGAGVVYGSQAGMDNDGSTKGGAGINIGGEYFFTDKISAAPSFTYFFRSKAEFYGAEITARASSLNLDGRYYFSSNNGLSVYGLAGLAVGFASVKVEGDGYYVYSSSGTESKAGLNLGAGLTYALQSDLDFNAQIKYNTPLEQVVLQVGIAFPIN